MIASTANGLGPFGQLRSLTKGAILDQLRNGPLDKHGAGSPILSRDVWARLPTRVYFTSR
jgi:hypothetical protein